MYLALLSIKLKIVAAGKKAASAAASAAYDANIDTAVALGWSYVERVAFQAFTEELQTAPESAYSALQQLATLYGLTRVERGLAFFLASGKPKTLSCLHQVQ